MKKKYTQEAFFLLQNLSHIGKKEHHPFLPLPGKREILYLHSQQFYYLSRGLLFLLSYIENQKKPSFLFITDNPSLEPLLRKAADLSGMSFIGPPLVHGSFTNFRKISTQESCLLVFSQNPLLLQELRIWNKPSLLFSDSDTFSWPEAFHIPSNYLSQDWVLFCLDCILKLLSFKKKKKSF